MWTSTLELDAAHVIPVQILGRFWRGAYFSSFAPLQVRNVPRQSLPATRWVRVRNILAGICGSDLHLVFADGDLRVAPAALPVHSVSYPGHEVLGEVIEVGDEVQHVRVGDRVVLQHSPNCITADLHPPCRSCAAGNYYLCERGKLPGPQPIGGGWSEEMLIHEQQLFRVPSTINDEQAVMLEPTSVALHTVLRRLPEPGERVLVVGAGSIGLLIVHMLHTLSPQAEISVVARHAFQVEQATRLGAAHIIYPQDSYQSVQRITGAELHRGSLGNRMLLGGFDVIFDTISTRRTTYDALRWTRAGGTVVMIGVNLHSMRIDLTPVWYQQVNLIGSVANGSEIWPIGSTQRRQTFDIVAEMMEQGIIHPEQLITHRFALTSFRDALQTATHKGQSRSLKVVFDYSLMPPSVVPNVRASRPRRQPALTAPIAQPAEPEANDTNNTNNVPTEDNDADERTVVFARPPRTPLMPRTPAPIVMPHIPPTPPTPLAPVLSDMVPPPLLEDDEMNQPIIVSQSSQPPLQSVQQNDTTEDILTPLPVATDDTLDTPDTPTMEPVQVQAPDEEATKTVVVSKSRRSRQRKTTTGTIATAQPAQPEPAEQTTTTQSVSADTAPALPDDAAPPLEWLNMNTPDVSDSADVSNVSDRSDLTNAPQEYQPQSDAMPQWLSSLHIVGTANDGTSTPPATEEESSPVTNGDARALLPVEELEEPTVPTEQQPSPSEDENNTHP